MTYRSPVVDEVSDETFEETDTCLQIHTKHGLRARAYYVREDHPEYTIYADGDREYALAAFVLYMYYETGDMPVVNDVSSPMRGLTYQ